MSVSEYIDRDAETIKSVTGELRMDYGTGIATMNTQKAQGAAGFLGRKGAIQLDNATIDMKNDYGAVMVVAMDDRPLAESKKIFVQCMTIDQMYGWETSGEGGLNGTIRSVGSAPWGVEKFDVLVTLKLNGEKPGKITACDENGYATDKPVESSGDARNFTVKIDEATAYTIIER